MAEITNSLSFSIKCCFSFGPWDTDFEFASHTNWNDWNVICHFSVSCAGKTLFNHTNVNEKGWRKCTRLPYKTLIPFLMVQLCNTFGGELEMRQKGPDRIYLQPREETMSETFLSWQQESLVVISMNISNGKGSQGPKPDPVVTLFSCISWLLQTKPKPPPILGGKRAQEEDKMDLA